MYEIFLQQRPSSDGRAHEVVDVRLVRQNQRESPIGVPRVPNENQDFVEEKFQIGLKIYI